MLIFKPMKYEIWVLNVHTTQIILQKSCYIVFSLMFKSSYVSITYVSFFFLILQKANFTILMVLNLNVMLKFSNQRPVQEALSVYFFVCKLFYQIWNVCDKNYASVICHVFTPFQQSLNFNITVFKKKYYLLIF